MSDLNITIKGKKRLLTAGKRCDKNIVVTAEGGDPSLQEKTITVNGEYTADSGYDGLSKVTVNVPVPDGYVIPTGTKSITENGMHSVSGYANAEVNVPVPDGYIKPSGTVSITESGTYDVSEYASAEVNVAGAAVEEYDGTISVTGEPSAEYDGTITIT